VFLGDYEAICSYKDGTVQAFLSNTTHIAKLRLKELLSGANSSDIDDNETETLLDESIDTENITEIFSLEDSNSQIKISVCEGSDDLVNLTRPMFYGNRRRPMSLVITGLNISKHDEALDYLQRISDSLFFQIDIEFELRLELMRMRKPIRRFVRKKNDSEYGVQFPRTEFDKAPMSLYWYAQRSKGLLLLQFLAYYQVIEFYFITYSEEVARRRIGGILKDPAFRVDRNTDITRILSAIDVKARGFGDERSQLKATINACIDPDSLREFLSADEERKIFFTSKQKGLTDCKVLINNPTADLRNDVAELIYDIRCRIVHMKGGGEDGKDALLLPFSKEANLLIMDIELMLFVARQVLIHSSSSMAI
jgi:hypothetical protein